TRSDALTSSVTTSDMSTSSVRCWSDHARQPAPVVLGQPRRILVDECRNGLRGGTLEERVQDVPQGRASGVIARHFRQIDVARPFLVVPDLPLFLEDAQESAHGGVAGRVRQRLLYLRRG